MAQLRHLAIIMDGNRRWAKKQGVSLLYDQSSSQAVYNAIEFCQESDIAELSLYAFSLENLKNRDDELRTRVFDVLYQACTTKRDRMINSNVRVRFVGQRSVFPEHLVPVMEKLEHDTKDATGLRLNILFCYGAQQEITDACKRVAKKVALGELRADQIIPATITDHLWTTPSTPPDLVIRTSGVMRLSNFLLFQAAYSEWQFLDCYWPEVTKETLTQCMQDFANTTRNFGK